jgi:exopolysaccharide biosynthesis WecB/TagA/CpsF family protein
MHHIERRAVARPAAPRAPRHQELQATHVLGCPIINDTVLATLDWLQIRLDRNEPARIAFLNAHCANLRARDPDYASALDSAHAVLPDGSGIGLALRLRGEKLTANLNGTDLIPALCQRLAKSGHSVFLLGGQPGVARAAAKSLVATAPGLNIAGTHHGFFAHDEESAIVRKINASGASVVLVAFGVPLQDVWLARNAARLTAPLTFGVGGLFDFLSGRIPRAPSVLRRTGLEWTYRLYQEPRRMWRRYILGNPEFVARAVSAALTRPAVILRTADLAAKRALDVTAAGLGLVALAPLFLAVAAAVRVESKGPAFLRQTRIGKDGVPSTVFKFRSMVNDAEARRAALFAENTHGADAVTFKVKRDPRITRVGRVLRVSSIDELPQLLNVLNGTMSLVGPRPPLPAEVMRYTPHQRRRLACTPGITGLWQVSGRANIAFPQQVELDIAYLSRRNIFLDLSILARTVPAVLLARGAY